MKHKLENLIVNNYIELTKENFKFSLNNSKNALFYDEFTNQFILTYLEINKTVLESKTCSNITTWRIEIPGNADIISVKISPDLTTVAIQRSSYYIEFVKVTLNQNV